MNNKPTPELVMQDLLNHYLAVYIYNYTLRVDNSEMILIQFNLPAQQAVDILNGHSMVSISSDATPLEPVPDVGQRGLLPAYTTPVDTPITITGACTTFRLWLNNEDVTPVDDNWDGSFVASTPGNYVLEGRNGFNTGFILIEVTS